MAKYSVSKVTNTKAQGVLIVDSSGNPVTSTNPLISTSGLGIGTYDYVELSNYSGANPQTIVFKTGGSSGTTIATLTLAYSGSNLVSVTKS